MAQIKNGFNEKPTQIRVIGRSDSRTAEVWIVQEGLDKAGQPEQRYETLAYATVDELIDLKDEVAEAIKKIAGV